MTLIHRLGDRRGQRKGGLTISAQPQPLEDLCRRIRGEYIEMPGLRLTATQAQRLWGLDRIACEAVLSALVDVKFLVRNQDGAFVRRS